MNLTFVFLVHKMTTNQEKAIFVATKKENLMQKDEIVSLNVSSELWIKVCDYCVWSVLNF